MIVDIKTQDLEGSLTLQVPQSTLVYIRVNDLERDSIINCLCNVSSNGPFGYDQTCSSLNDLLRFRVKSYIVVGNELYNGYRSHGTSPVSVV